MLFACAITENIAYTSIENATKEQIENAAKQANAHNFISDLPNGYNTMLGEKGISLSGSQKLLELYYKGRHQELIKIPNDIFTKLAEKQMVLVNVEEVMDVLEDKEKFEEEKKEM